MTLKMSFLNCVTRAMERIAPVRLAEKWDNVGLLLESPVQKQGPKKIMLTIDLTTSVLNEALIKNTSASLLKCAASGISVYSPHTALDSVWGGVNDWLAEGVIKAKEDGQVRALVREKVNTTTGISEGAEGRLVTLKVPISMDVLEKRIKSHLKLAQIQVGYPIRSTTLVRSIAICAGSGGSMLVDKDADVYLTGEMSHHEVLATIASGRYVVLCGHTNTERGYLPVLAQKLCKELESERCEEESLEDVEVLVSETDRHPLEFV